VSGGLLVWGAVAGRSGERDIGELSGESIKGHGFWKMKPRILDGRSRRVGDEFWKKRQRILAGEEVADFVWRCARKVRKCTTLG